MEAVQEQEGIVKRVFDALNFGDHTNRRDPYGLSTLGQRWQDKTIGKEWREGQMADVWDLLPDEWKPGVAEWGKGMAEKFGTAWMDARTLEGKEWLDPGKIAAAGTARTIEGLGLPFELIAQATSQATGLDIELSRVAADFIPVGGIASKVSRAAKRSRLLRRSLLLADGSNELLPLLQRAVKENNVNEMKRVMARMESLDKNFIRQHDALSQIKAAITTPRTSAQIDEAIELIREARYTAPTQPILGSDKARTLLLEPKKKLDHNKIIKQFGDNLEFQNQVADYLNIAYLWRKGKKGLDPSQPMKGFPLGNTIVDPEGNLWRLSSQGRGKGYRLVEKSRLDEYAKWRASVRKINTNEVRTYIEDILTAQGIDIVDAARYADDYIEFNRSGKRHLVKRVEEINKKAGRVVVSIDHITAIEKWQGTGADIYMNLMLMDKIQNSRIGAKQNKALNLALGTVDNIKDDITLWLDQFGPNATQQLGGFFRNMSSEKRKILWDAVMLRGIQPQDALQQINQVNDILYKLDFGEDVFQGSLF